MEPRGRDQWQPSQIAQAQKPRNQAKTVAADCDRLPETFHGKEGVDGSSPSEGFRKGQPTALLCCLARRMTACVDTVRWVVAADASEQVLVLPARLIVRT